MRNGQSLEEQVRRTRVSQSKDKQEAEQVVLKTQLENESMCL